MVSCVCTGIWKKLLLLILSQNIPAEIGENLENTIELPKILLSVVNEENDFSGWAAISFSRQVTDPLSYYDVNYFWHYHCRLYDLFLQ